MEARPFRKTSSKDLSVQLIREYITGYTNGRIYFQSLRYINEEDEEDFIKIKDILGNDLDRIQSLFSVLDDLVEYKQLSGFWSRFIDYLSLYNNPNANSTDPTDFVNQNLTRCDQTIRHIFRILGADDYLNKKEEGKNYTFGSLLFDKGIDNTISDKKGRFNTGNESVNKVIKLLLNARNEATHPSTSSNTQGVSISVPQTWLECKNNTSIVLVALLHIVDYHYNALDSFFNDYYATHQVPTEDPILENPFNNPEEVKRNYVNSLLDASNHQLLINVGNVGNIENEESLKLMNLKMQLVWKDQTPVVDNSYSENDDDYSQHIITKDLKQITTNTEDENRINVLLGNPGSGKSTLLLQLQKHLCSRWLEGGTDTLLPVPMALKNVTQENFTDAFKAMVGERVFNVVEPMCKDGKVIFIMDGLNELTLQNPSVFLDSLCNTIRSEYRKCRFYISGRIHEFDDVKTRFQQLAACSIYQMLEISKDDIDRYFKELKASEKSTNIFFDFVGKKQLENLLASPLNFSMMSKMILNQKDSSVPVESINNRGELLDLFLKSTIRDSGEITEDIDGETFKMLQHLAVALDKHNNHSITLGEFVKDLYYEENSLERELLLIHLCRLNVLAMEKGINGEHYYAFAIDTYQEYFHARSIAVGFVGDAKHGISAKPLSKCLSEEIEVHENRRIEMLRLALELIDGGCIQKDTAKQEGERFVKEFLVAYPDSFTTLAELSASLPTSSRARALAEKTVLDVMHAYKDSHPDPAPEENKNQLLDIINSAAKLSTDRLFEELFSLYWMSATGMTAFWEFGFTFKLSNETTTLFRTHLVSHCTDPSRFYNYLHNAMLDILPLYRSSGSFLNVTRNMLFSGLTTYRQKILYRHIKECYQKSRENAYADHLLSQDASLLLMYMDDPEYIYHNMDLNEMREAGTKISTHTLMKLLKNYLHPYTPKIIFQKEFLDLLEARKKNSEEQQENKFIIATAIRYFLFRNHRPPELLKYLSEGGLESLNEHEILPILDLLPINELREYKDRYYDADIFQYLDEYDGEDEEESAEGLHYRIFKQESDCTHVWIRDITTPLKNLTAVVGPKQATIVEDKQVICKQYRFKIKSTAIINASGVMKVADQEVIYVAPYADAEIVFTTFDDELAGFLTRTNTVKIGEEDCSVVKIYESRPKSWRVLTLEGNVHIPYYGDMQFRQGNKSVDIDKTIKDDGYRYDPQLYRSVEESPTQNCSELPYIFLGSSSSKVWIVTDKLADGDQARDVQLIVRPKGHIRSCRFLESHPFTGNFVELSFRSSIPFDFPQDGELVYSLQNQVEEVVPYIFCHRTGTRLVVRIMDGEFVRAVNDYETRKALSKGYFRIGELSLLLDYIEIFPGSECFSIWTLQKSSNEPFPNSGYLELWKSDDCKEKVWLSFTDETLRNPTPFQKCSCLCYDTDNNLALIAVEESIAPIPTGLYLTNDNSAAHLKITHSIPCSWTAETSFIPNLRIPPKGKIALDNQVTDFQYIVTKTEGSINTAVFFTQNAESDFESFQKNWLGSDTIQFISNDGTTCAKGIREKSESLILSDRKHLLWTDAPRGFDASKCSADGWYLSVFCPVKNEMERGYDSVVKTIKVHSIPYRKISNDEIVIRQPMTDIARLYVRPDDSSVYASLEIEGSESNNEFIIHYCTVRLHFDNGRQTGLKQEGGKIGFYAKQSDGRYVPVSVGYSRVLEVIDIDSRKETVNSNNNRTAKYHYYPSQICDILKKELSELDIINEGLLAFFADHSRAYMLLQDNQFIGKIQKLNCTRPLINLCTLKSIDNDGKINAYSWLINNSFPSMDVVDSQIENGSLLLIERNHKITLANADNCHGNAFPTIGVLPSLENNYCGYTTAVTNCEKEEKRIKEFKDRIKILIELISPSLSATPTTDGELPGLRVKIPGSTIETDPHGIVVISDKINDVRLRLCGVSEEGYQLLQRGEPIQVVPSNETRKKFNPYKFTPKGIIFLSEPSNSLMKNAIYYCIVKLSKKKGKNQVNVICGDYIGSFLNQDGSFYRAGELVLLQLTRISREGGGKWCYFSKDINKDVTKINQINICPGETLQNILITNNGSDNSFIKVLYQFEGGSIEGTVDHLSIPHFSSRMINGVYHKGTQIALRVTKINEEGNNVYFELLDKTVHYPFPVGTYPCTIHRNYSSIQNFEFWRLSGQLSAWASFQYQGQTFTVEIPPEEMLPVDNNKNIYDGILTCGQGIPVEIKIAGFDENGDPIVKLKSHHDEVLHKLTPGSVFTAKIYHLDIQNQIALWITQDKSGWAHYRVKPPVWFDINIVKTEPDENGNCRFMVDNESISPDCLSVGDVLDATFNWDDSYTDETLFVATEQSTNRRFLCKHTDTDKLSQYWLEYLICLGNPLKAKIDDVQDGVHCVTFLPEIENNIQNTFWKIRQKYDVKVVCYTRNYVIVEYVQEDLKEIIGAIPFKHIDPFFKTAPDTSQYPIGGTISVALKRYNMSQNALFFDPISPFSGQFPYGLKENEVVSGLIYKTDRKGCAYVKIVGDAGVRVKMYPFFSERSVLASGKSVVQAGDTRQYSVSYGQYDNIYLKMSPEYPWKACSLSTNEICPVTIIRVDPEQVLVQYKELYGEIPTSEFNEELETLTQRVGETIDARISFVNTFAHTLCFTTKGLESLRKVREIHVGDVIVAKVIAHANNTPVLEWEGNEFQITPSQASFLVQEPWNEKVDVLTKCPIDSSFKLVVKEIDNTGRITRVDPCNRGSANFIGGLDTSAVVLKCGSEGIYAKTNDDPENECLVYVPKGEILWGRVYCTQNFYKKGSIIQVVRLKKKGTEATKPHLCTCSIKRLLPAPNLQLEADRKVSVQIEKILPGALNVLCNGILCTQISIEDTTWHPKYIIGEGTKLSKRFKEGDVLKASVEEGGVDQDIRLSLRSSVNPWKFNQISVGNEWDAYILKIIDERHFVVDCRGLLVLVNNNLGMQVSIHDWVKVHIKEVEPDEPYASAILLGLPAGNPTPTPLNADDVPFNIGHTIPVRITRIHHPSFNMDKEAYLNVSPMEFPSMGGVINNTDLAWNPKDRNVDNYRVGDELNVVVTGINYKENRVYASLRETKKDTRSNIGEIVNNEYLSVNITGIRGQSIDSESGQAIHFVDFSYGSHVGRITLPPNVYTAIQEPTQFFQSGCKMRVKTIGVIARKGKQILNAVIPFLNNDCWNKVAGMTDEKKEEAIILSIYDEELFVQYAEHFVVKMTREQLVRESYLPLRVRFKIGQNIPVYPVLLDFQEHVIQLVSKELQISPNPYENLSIETGVNYVGKIIAEDKNQYYLDLTIDNNRVICRLPYTEFPYKWHRHYEKGDKIEVSIKELNLGNSEIIVTRNVTNLLSQELEFHQNEYYWFKVYGYKKNGIVLEKEGYRVLMAWEDAWLMNVSDPSDMYPVGLYCLLRVKDIQDSVIHVEANYDWDTGVKEIDSNKLFEAEVCLRNPANGIVMRKAGSSNCFCMVTKLCLSEPIMSDILSFLPKNKYLVKPIFKKKKGDKALVYFNNRHRIVPSEDEYKSVKQGMVVTGIVKRLSDKYFIVSYNNIQMAVAKDYVNSNTKKGDFLPVRITHHEHYTDSNGKYVSMKLLGSAYAVKDNPFLELPVGTQVSGHVAIATTREGQQIHELSVEIPQKCMVIGKLLLPYNRRNELFRGQRVVAYVSSHNYQTHEIQFSLSRPNINKLSIGSIVKATVLELRENNESIVIDVSYHENHYKHTIRPEDLFWGHSLSSSIIQVGNRFNMAVLSLDKTGTPLSLTRRELFPDYRSSGMETVRGRVMAYREDGCVIMAGATLGLLPIKEMSYQRCDLWQEMFRLQEYVDLMVCPDYKAYLGTTVFSYRRTLSNPFENNDPTILIGKRKEGKIVRTNKKDKVVVQLKDDTRFSGKIEALITNPNIFSDGFQVFIPEVGTDITFSITNVERGNDGNWIIKAYAIRSR